MKSFLLLLFIPFFFIACNKQNESPVNPTDTTGNEPAIPTDTLSAGWTKIILPDSMPLTDIFFANNQLGYAIADIYLFKSTDGGLTWTKSDSTGSGGGDNLAVTPNGNVFISSGYNNVIFKATYGERVKAQKIENIYGDADIFFTSNDTGYISRGYSGDKQGLWKTVNGGNTWTLIPIAGYSVNLQSYISFSQHTGYCTNANIYHTNSSGDIWPSSIVTATDSFISINAVNASVAYAAGYSGVIYKTIDGGISFNKTGGALQPRGFLDLAFVDEQTGYATNGYRLYKTVDGGVHWTMEVSVAKGMLVEVHFTDAKHGWACGMAGTILVYRG